MVIVICRPIINGDRYRFGVTVIIVHCTFSKPIVGLIEEYSLSCECLERLDLGLNSGWVSFRARFIKLFFFLDFAGR